MANKLIEQKKNILRNNSVSVQVLGSKSEINDFKEDQSLELLSQLYANSMPRSLANSAIANRKIDLKSRDDEYISRYEMYEDTFTREMVKVCIARAIGTTHDNIKPFSLLLNKNIQVSDAVREAVNKELEILVDIIDETLLEVTIDSQFFGDGYGKRLVTSENGVEKILCNFSTKPINIIPIVTNKGTTVAYEVSPNLGLLGKNYMNSIAMKSHTKNGRNYVSEMEVARLNSPSNGINKISSDSISQIDNMNLFDGRTLVYEDTIYGGILEGCKDSFNNYQWAIKALVNRRIASSVVERFVIHNLANVGEPDRELLKKALEKQIQSVQNKIKERVDNKDPSLLTANHIIPTTGEGVNNISIQESSPDGSGLANPEDIMIHIKRYIADIGFNMEMTPFGSQSIGGNEKDGVIQNTLQMDIQGEQIRKGIRNYVLDTVRVHFLAKYNLEIDTNQIDVDFISVLNQAKLTAEQQRMETLSNTQQFGSLIEQFKSMGLKDNEDNRTMLYEMIEPIISQTSKNKDIQVKSIIEIILTPPEENKDGGEF